NTKELFIILEMFSNAFTTQTLVEEIGQGSLKITELVKALKSYSYLDQGPNQSINIHQGLNDTLIMLRSKLKMGVQIEQEYEANLPLIDAYGSELNQVWTNLIDNAISAMKGNGKITIRTYRENSHLVVEIIDSGPGIPKDIESKIFDPFFTTKAPGEGTGLGLSISYNIITQKHKGQMKVNSKPGETCFQVKLPLKI
ncbi:MAG TPA: ATP-binding protein, partial [Draconibacterium sp.]|nr:ATP-binding protein [Draconibacterium sp.]